jgi:uncharacterized protein (TIGR04222 family)
MSQPWGLSGPQFLGVYAAGIGLTVAIPLIFRQVIRRVPGREMARQLDPYEVGYLVGGPRRVAEMILAGQVDSGALRVDSAGKLSEADRSARTGPYADSLDRITPAGMPDGLRTSAIREKLKSDPVIAGIGRGLRADEFIVSSGRITALRLVTAVSMAALLITGILRMIEGASNHRPIGFLFMLILLSVFADIALIALTLMLPPSSTAGAAYLKRLRETRESSRSLVAPGAAGAPGSAVAMLAAEAVLLGVALEGFGGVPDEATRAALLAGMPSSSGGGGGGCGGGCGGGGCGGGGCGG